MRDHYASYTATTFHILMLPSENKEAVKALSSLALNFAAETEKYRQLVDK